MDGEQKKLLRALSLELRHTLEGYYDAQGRWQPGDLERRLNELGVWRDRTPKPLGELPQLSPEDRTARRMLDTFLEVRKEAGVVQTEAVAEFVRESAYTWANRLLALRCMEARGIIDEVIVQKDVYGGRSLKHNRFARKNPELCAGADDGLFTVLFVEFAERALELPALFRPTDPAVLMRPSVAALKRCISLLSGLEGTRNLGPVEDVLFELPDALGWAYQYWNAEEKDRVFEMVRTQKGARIEGADIVPATQLYTEPYMVKFLLQNSLGALWVRMHPQTALTSDWHYFVEGQRTSSEEKKPVAEICLFDPACGSGHFLLEAFNLLFTMYEEEGRLATPDDIAASILRNNLYGVDIDERAVQISAAVLWMRAKEKAPDLEASSIMEFWEHLVSTNIQLPKGKDHLKAFLEKHPEDAPLRSALEVVFSGLENAHQLGTLLQIEEPVEKELRRLKGLYDASLKRGVQMKLLEPVAVQGALPSGTEDYEEWKQKVIARVQDHFKAEAEEADLSQAFFSESAEKGLALFSLLARRYDVVATNPPYMGSKNMGVALKKYVERFYPSGKRDLYAAFILRCLQLARRGGRVAMVTQQSWMFLKSFGDLRANNKLRGQPGEISFRGLLRDTTFETLVHLGEHAFDDPAAAGAFVVLFSLVNTGPAPEHRFAALRLVGPKSPEEKDALLLRVIQGSASAALFWPHQLRLAEIPQSPVSYWLRERLVDLITGPTLEPMLTTCDGLSPGGKDRFLRFHWEVATSTRRWVPFAKGGGYCRWFGKQYYVVDWFPGKTRIEQFSDSRIQNERYYMQFGLTYSVLARGALGLRLLGPGEIFYTKSPGIFFRDEALLWTVLGYGQSRLISFLLRSVCQGIEFYHGSIRAMPRFAGVSSALAIYAKFCTSLKCFLVAHDLPERSCDPALVGTVSRRPELAVSALLHTVEGIAETLVFASHGLDATDSAVVVEETGTPVGWYALVEGYDLIPTMPEGLPEIPSTVASFLDQHERRRLSPQALTDLRQRLRFLYEGGLTLQEDTSEDGDDTAEGDEGEAQVGARIPIPTQTWLEEISQKLEIHPISIYWLLQEGIDREGWRCLTEEKRVLEDRVTVTVLQLLGHRWLGEAEVGKPASGCVGQDGIIPISDGCGDKTLLARVREHFVVKYGKDATRMEREFAVVVGTGLEEWLATLFFKRHVSQFKRRPIAWQIQSAPAYGRRGRRSSGKSAPAFSCLIYYHNLDADLVPKLRSQYVGPLRQRYETELRTLEANADMNADQESNRIVLINRIEELKDFDARLESVANDGFGCGMLDKLSSIEVLDQWTARTETSSVPADREGFRSQEGRYDPDLNEGVRVNIAPFQRNGLLVIDVLNAKDVDKAIADRAEWRADERRWCREGKLAQPGWWPTRESK